MADTTNPILKEAQGYRAGETLPTKFDPTFIIDMARTAGYAVKNLKVPQAALDMLPGLMLKEGRVDAGVNGVDNNNTTSTNIVNDLVKAGFDTRDSQYPATFLEKSQTASRLGIPFGMAWNGTGKSKDSGKTGAQYGATLPDFLKTVAQDPRNAPFIDLIKRASTGNLTPVEQLTTKTNSTVVKEAYGELPKSMDLTLQKQGEYPFADAILDALKKANVDISSNDTISKALGSPVDGSNYTTWLSDVVSATGNYARQQVGAPVRKDVDKNLAKELENPIMKQVLDTLSAPIVSKYQPSGN